MQKLQFTQKSLKKILGRKDKGAKAKSGSNKHSILQISAKPQSYMTDRELIESFNGYGSRKSSKNEQRSSITPEIEKMLDRKDKQILNLKYQVNELQFKLKNTENYCEHLKNVSKFECAGCKWLVQKDNFATHLNFCTEKATNDDTSEDCLVKITNEPETRIKQSFSTEVFQDI